MQRRTLLAMVGGGTLSVAGCLSIADRNNDPSTETLTPAPTPMDPDGRRYEECSREVIPYDQFPADVQTEIDAALGGRYEADRVFLEEAMDVDESYVSVDEAYYDPSVTVEDDTEVLELDVVEPKALPRPRPLSVEQQRDGERTITLEVVTDDGTLLLEETRTLRVGPVEFGRLRRVGSHEIRITVEDGDEVEDEVVDAVRIDESHFDIIVVVEEDDVYVTGGVAELGICQYDAE